MKLCKKCGTKIPYKIIIGGKSHNLRNRKYCLECSPFGCKNNKQLHLLNKQDIKHCNQCDRDFDITTKSNRFFWKKNNLCFSCYQKNRSKQFKADLIAYLGGKCLACGYHKCSRALIFHHIDPKTKLFGISGKYCLSFEKLKLEADKCILLCNRCHEELHDGLIELPKK